MKKKQKKIKNISYLAQGTIYPDVIESSVSGTSKTIKTHHNVGGLPKKMNLKVLEPFRFLFKDEIRKIAKKLGVDDSLIHRHPFPGPGLAVRIIGEVTVQKIKILQKADNILISELKKNKVYKNISQAAAILLPIKTVAVKGDNRRYENVIALRCVKTVDFMSASWSKLDYDILEEISNKITNQINISRVVYDITNKPPATIEWE